MYNGSTLGPGANALLVVSGVKRSGSKKKAKGNGWLGSDRDGWLVPSGGGAVGGGGSSIYSHFLPRRRHLISKQLINQSGSLGLQRERERGGEIQSKQAEEMIEMQEEKREAEKLRAENGGERVIGRQSETEADLERTLVEPFLQV
ncbi:hypothetical protein FVEG_02545 [Fusarium verticillioides 7600]|uniref:Uncharacterized protein n=1 Tax=Gibberella moniliformis (strain M3125 / FGSC 7600) TaxID=334819 RepID=W7M4X4_GIBM7|nr:hypothetical protein FVEG_02545 [Fusarium verticillioides 7600]EWG39917.1 hypothetical protein FVEG_02545 [Fusarium verticillioides 7600]